MKVPSVPELLQGATRSVLRTGKREADLMERKNLASSGNIRKFLQDNEELDNGIRIPVSDPAANFGATRAQARVQSRYERANIESKDDPSPYEQFRKKVDKHKKGLRKLPLDKFEQKYNEHQDELEWGLYDPAEHTAIEEELKHRTDIVINRGTNGHSKS